jgi:2-hydroxy-6-oxonona-2,4-dienedioate hydrolase
VDANEASALIERLDRQATHVETRCGPLARMVWRRWGQGRPVILLHGGAGSWLHWIRNIEALAAVRTVWAPDMPGFGDSDLPSEGLDADSLAPYVLQGALELLRDKPFDLVGFSLGAMVSAVIAAEAPETLEHVVLISILGMGLVSGGPTLKRMRGVTDPQEKADIVRFNLNTLMLHDPSSIDGLALAVQERGAPRDRVKNRKIVYSDILFHLSNRWRCAAYGIWGLQDPSCRDQPDKLIAAVNALNLREKVFLEDAGHWLQYERHSKCNALLGQFLGSSLTDIDGIRGPVSESSDV